MRLFYAIALGADVQAALAASLASLDLDPRRFRAAPPAAYHLTLRFLGEVDGGRLPDLAAIGKRAASSVGPIPCVVSGLGTFPGGPRARVIWAGIEDLSAEGDLASVARRLEDALREAGFPAEERPFVPHVTLARARARGPAAVAIAPYRGPIARFVAAELSLVRSQLGPGGSRHEVLAAFPFLAPAR